MKNQTIPSFFSDAGDVNGLGCRRFLVQDIASRENGNASHSPASPKANHGSTLVK